MSDASFTVMLSKTRKVARGLLTVKGNLKNLLFLGIALLGRVGQVLFYVLGLKIDDYRRSPEDPGVQAGTGHSPADHYPPAKTRCQQIINFRSSRLRRWPTRSRQEKKHRIASIKSIKHLNKPPNPPPPTPSPTSPFLPLLFQLKRKKKDLKKKTKNDPSKMLTHEHGDI